jgi:tetratricopeptide (TPR) repeat protein
MSSIERLEDLLRKGHYAQARTYAKELLTSDSDHRLEQLYALSLSKSGVPEAAQEYFESIAPRHPDNPETMGILGGIYKELFKKNQSPKYAVLARDTYAKNFEITKNYYTGINAATMSALAGQGQRGKDIARQVLQVLKDPENDFWQAVTQAEAYLLVKERAKAEQSYSHARKLAGADWGKINSVYNQLWLLNHYINVPGEVLKAFSPPVVVAFVGHMIDHPARPQPRFPESIESDVKEALRTAIKTTNAKIGYCSLACGGDILFAEAMEEAGGELNLFLPFNREDFLNASVRFAGVAWEERFIRLVNNHQVRYLTDESYEDHADLFLLQSNVIFGLSVLRAAANHQQPILISVLSERDQSKKTGGTRDTLALWPFKRNHVNINPDVFLNKVPDLISETPYIPSSVSTRPVLYFVACDYFSEDKWTATLLSEVESAGLQMSAIDKRSAYMIAGFKSIVSAMEFCEMIKKVASRTIQKLNAIRICLHVSPQHIVSGLSEQEISGEVMTTIDKLYKLTAPGTICATALVAAVLTLQSNKYSFDFIDTLTTFTSKSMDVFRVQAIKVAGVS